MIGWIYKYSTGLLIFVGLFLIILGAAGTVRLISPQDDVVVLDSHDQNEVDTGFGFAPFVVPISGALSQDQIAPTLASKTSLDKVKSSGLSESRSDGIEKPGEAQLQNIPTSNLSPVSQDGVAPEIPARVVIESISLDAPVMQARSRKVWMAAQQYSQWLAPDMFAVGWHPSSALLGAGGNTVLNGHHNVDGMVFAHLVDVNEGDLIKVMGAQRVFTYVVVNKMILPEVNTTPEQRLENARWIMPSSDERLTLVTCWPFESNTHRLVIVAAPTGSEPIY